MKVSKNLILKIVIFLIITLGTLAFASVLYFLYWVRFIKMDVEKGKQRQVRLLCETDYQVLLEACRELSRRVATGDLKPDQYNVRLNPHPAASRFPQPILDLEPTYVAIEPDGSVQIELHGGFLSYGALAYPEDYEKPKHADKKLIDGLWYYDDGYREENPKYQKWLDELIQKGKKRQLDKNIESGNRNRAP